MTWNPGEELNIEAFDIDSGSRYGGSSLKRQITEKCVKKQPVSELIRNIVRIQENKFGIDSILQNIMM